MWWDEFHIASRSCLATRTDSSAHLVFVLWDRDTASVYCPCNIGQFFLRPVCCVVCFLLSLNATYFKHASTSCSTTKTKPNDNSNNPFSASSSLSGVPPDCTAGSCLKTNITDRLFIRERMREEPAAPPSASLSSVCFLLCASGCSVCKI